MPKFKLKFVAHQERETIVEAKDFMGAVKLADAEEKDLASGIDTRCAGWELKAIEEIDG